MFFLIDLYLSFVISLVSSVTECLCISVEQNNSFKVVRNKILERLDLDQKSYVVKVSNGHIYVRINVSADFKQIFDIIYSVFKLTTIKNFTQTEFFQKKQNKNVLRI